jgi:hypothetical protein
MNITKHQCLAGATMSMLTDGMGMGVLGLRQRSSWELSPSIGRTSIVEQRHESHNR